MVTKSFALITFACGKRLTSDNYKVLILEQCIEHS